MTGSDLYPNLPDFARGLASGMANRAEGWSDSLRSVEGRLTAGVNDELFGEFEEVLTRAVDRYASALPRSWGDGTRLVFQPLYDDAKAAGDARPRRGDDRPAVLLTALLAALVEAHAPLRLTRLRMARLAAVLFRLGEAVNGLGLSLHAKAAYAEAARLSLDVSDYPSWAASVRKLASVRHGARFRTAGRGALFRAALDGGVVVFLAVLGVLAYVLEVPFSHTASPLRALPPAALVVMAAALAMNRDASRRASGGPWWPSARLRDEWMAVAVLSLLAVAAYLMAADADRVLHTATAPNHIVEPTGAAQIVVAVGGLISSIGLSAAAVIKALSLLLQARADLVRARSGIEAAAESKESKELKTVETARWWKRRA